ncbi:hypothetical protein OI18_20020 [Flavihumibacter solisilvae]|uniref:Pentapeptide repeat-containing protein n=2 Tax=Flavihumibacter solisilvae TaxID=1349421 RepID=A0A0C1LC07_9BACT|nr:hypothetical protein OI18_20020 [Flavihumibacter solisilvae]
MVLDYSHKNLQMQSLKNLDLSNASFEDSDLRGTDFSGSNLTGADFTHARTGMTPMTTAWIFLVALIVSALSGYIAMLAGHTMQEMLASPDVKVRVSGIVTITLVILFILVSMWRGVGNSIRILVIPAAILALIIGIINYSSGLGTGRGMLYLIISLILIVIMFIVGTISRVAAGDLSNILFFIVALAGGMFAQSVGGGIGTLVMALSCAVISKRALKGTKGFESLHKIATYFTQKFGTSFRNTRLTNANFSRSKIHNADFSHADISDVKWRDAKKLNCIIDNA